MAATAGPGWGSAASRMTGPRSPTCCQGHRCGVTASGRATRCLELQDGASGEGWQLLAEGPGGAHASLAVEPPRAAAPEHACCRRRGGARPARRGPDAAERHAPAAALIPIAVGIAPCRCCGRATSADLRSRGQARSCAGAAALAIVARGRAAGTGSRGIAVAARRSLAPGPSRRARPPSTCSMSPASRSSRRGLPRGARRGDRPTAAAAAPGRTLRPEPARPRLPARSLHGGPGRAARAEPARTPRGGGHDRPAPRVPVRAAGQRPRARARRHRRRAAPRRTARDRAGARQACPRHPRRAPPGAGRGHPARSTPGRTCPRRRRPCGRWRRSCATS